VKNVIEPFLSAVPVLKKLENTGYEAYFVGGSVRDLLLSKPISDVDIATSATPVEVKAIFPKTVDIGIEHGTVLVLFQNQSYEVTTFRTEAEYEDYRRPKDVTFIRNLVDDLKRRDFTMNAIAMDANGKLIDPFHGQEAIQNKLIQTVGNARERFEEDALRMMRAIRFVSQLSFEMESETLSSLSSLVPLLEKIAIERKRTEFEKLLVGKNRKEAIKLMIETNIYSFLPGLNKWREQLKQVLTFELDELTKNEMWSLLLYSFSLEEDRIELFLRSWRLPLKEIREIQLQQLFLNKRLKQELTIYDLYMAKINISTSVERLYQAINGFNKRKAISHLEEIYINLPIKDRSEISVTGNDLLSWFDRKGGPWVKEILAQVELAILEGKVDNQKNKIKEWLMECNQK
jgi:tRNA nucleotidyltransferase (CCA-adding enzyme)